MPLAANLVLGGAFVFVGLAAAILQYWLWTFPMEPDPSGRDPNGRTTAPPRWRYVHRLLGYVFLAIYVLLMVQMVPRLVFLEDETGSPVIYLHVAAGILIGILLLAKVVVLRVVPKFGKSLPWIGTGLLALAALLVGLAVGPAARLRALPVSNLAETQAREVLVRNCIGCHGATPILAGEGEDGWPKVLEEMREKARVRGGPDPVPQDAAALALYLERILPRPGEGEGRRGREREGRREESDDD